MLDNSALSQLKDLKKQLHDSVPRDTGVVKGTSKRFGFIVADKDGQQYLLPQTEMERVLPGDKVQFLLEKPSREGEKPIAKLEKFFSSDLVRFIGCIRIKKDQMYVIPDHPQFNRWVFIPPKFRKNLKEGDLVAAEIIQHPYKSNGRVQAKVAAMIGQPEDPYIEHRYAIVKNDIAEKIWRPEELEAVRQTAGKHLDETLPLREDWRDKGFVTIDGTNTQDLDDALYIESTEEGFCLHIAIADASEYVEPGSPLDKIASAIGTSIYLPGQKLSMLPDVLSADICSLKAGLDRLAIICSVNFSNTGEILSTRYTEAAINSKAKLNYDDVSSFINNDDDSFSGAIATNLKQLHQLSLLRQDWRETHAMKTDDYKDYRLLLDDRGKIIGIHKHERNIAQKLVEECMVACNIATAAYLNNHLEKGLYLAHCGFKKDQLPGVEKLIDNYLPGFDKTNVNTLEKYKALQLALKTNNSNLPFYDILRKKLTRSEWMTTHNPHFGLGVEAYTTFTSPIRKYSDLLIHRLIKAHLRDDSSSLISESTVDRLNKVLIAARNAQRDCELSLKVQYIEQFKGQQFKGEISLINHRNIGVYLEDFDVHGQIEVRSLDKGFTFKQDSLELIAEDQHFMLKQNVLVEIAEIDKSKNHIKLKLIEQIQ